MKKRFKFIFLMITFAFTASSFAQNIVEWRGTGRSGIYNETGLLKEWPAAGPQLLWSFDGLGKGFSSVIVAGGKIYTTGQTEDTGYLFAFDLKGKLLWKTAYGKEWTISYPGTRTTPVFYMGKLYMTTANGEALCLDAETGKQVWKVDMVQKFGARLPKWGFVESPTISDNKVYFTPGGAKTTLVALDLKNGETVWQSSATGEEAAYCSPLLFNYKNKKYLTTSTAGNVIGIDVNDGKLLWKVPQVSIYSINPNTPLFKDGQIYSVTGYKTGGVMMKLSDDGQSVTELWRNQTLDSQMGGVIWIGNHIVGSGHQSDRSWQCLDSNTGQVLFKTAEMGKGVVIYADGLYYCYGENGEFGLMELNENGFLLKSKFRIALGTEQHWAHPVIDQGILYVRHGNTLMAYSIKK